jgi:hypothetical protein
MSFASRIRRAAFAVCIAAAVSSGCSRWQALRAHEVPSQGDPRGQYAAVLEVVKAEKYSVVSEEPAQYRVRVEAKASTSQKSFIDIEVASDAVRLAGAGHLVRNGKIHKSLNTEIGRLEQKLAARLGVAPAGSASAAAAPVAAAPLVGLPESWSEPASDPAVWGTGNFTCLPVRVPPEHQGALVLRLSTGENADVQLSLAYAPELCRSPQKCKVAGGCPALGIGDSERVQKLAGRIKKSEITSRATLLDGTSAVASIELGQHGSIVQALSEMKK